MEYYNKNKMFSDRMSEDFIEKPVAGKGSRVAWGLSPLSLISTNFMKKSGQNSKGSFLQKDIMINWNNIVGDAMAGQIKPLKLSFKSKDFAVMEVAVRSSSLVALLQYEKRNILNKINSFTGKEVVKDIKFVHGK